MKMISIVLTLVALRWANVYSGDVEVPCNAENSKSVISSVLLKVASYFEKQAPAPQEQIKCSLVINQLISKYPNRHVMLSAKTSKNEIISEGPKIPLEQTTMMFNIESQKLKQTGQAAQISINKECGPSVEGGPTMDCIRLLVNTLLEGNESSSIRRQSLSFDPGLTTYHRIWVKDEAGPRKIGSTRNFSNSGEDSINSNEVMSLSESISKFDPSVVGKATTVLELSFFDPRFLYGFKEDTNYKIKIPLELVLNSVNGYRYKKTLGFSFTGEEIDMTIFCQ